VVKVKGGALLSRLAFVRENRGEEGVQKVLGRLSGEDRCACAQILTGGWDPFELNDRLDQAVAAEMGLGDNVCEKSAAEGGRRSTGYVRAGAKASLPSTPPKARSTASMFVSGVEISR
jgi:hypothetical protein